PISAPRPSTSATSCPRATSARFYVACCVTSWPPCPRAGRPEPYSRGAVRCYPAHRPQSSAQTIVAQALTGGGVAAGAVGRAIKAMHARRPGRIGHRGPVVLVEAGGVLQRLPVDIEHEAAIDGVELQRFPGHGEEFVAHAEKATEGEHRIGDAARAHLYHAPLCLGGALRRCFIRRFPPACR